MDMAKPEKVGARARELFESGWNCAEAVFLAIHEHFCDCEPPVNLLTSLGGGLGSKKTCGALTGAVVALGLRYGRTAPDRAAKELAYAKAQQLLKAFRESFHATDCWELTSTAENENERKRLCAGLVRTAAESAARLLLAKRV